jgi:hypothetical protein
MTKYQRLLRQAEKLAQSEPTWADFSNALFSPPHGILTGVFHTRAEREAFTKSKEYERIWELVSQAMDRSGSVEGATPVESRGSAVV